MFHKHRSAYERVMARSSRIGNCLVFSGARWGGNAWQYGCIKDNGRPKSAHRIVWEHHHGPTDLFVLHHCDKTLCVNIDHLFVGTQADNMRDMVGKGRAYHPRGEKAGMAILTWPQVIEIRWRSLRGERQVDLARVFRVAKGTIYNVVRGRTWTAS